MIDPFGVPPVALAKAVQPLAERLGLSTFPLHIHEMVFTCAFYTFFNAVVSPALSTWLFPKIYPQFSRRTKLNWDTHVSSLLQCCSITALALYVFWEDGERRAMGFAGRIWGYTGAIGAIQGLVEGYFFWDMAFCLVHYKDIGSGDLVHAISVLVITSLGFRPFANYYGLNFILYEISNPFMNMHWFFDKLNMTGSRPQFWNGIALIISFFFSRLVWGTYQTVCIFLDIWTTLTNDVNPQLVKDLPILGNGLQGLAPNAVGISGNLTMPLWLVVLYVGGNTALTMLNVYWFSLMIKALRKRFQPQKKIAQKQQ